MANRILLRACLFSLLAIAASSSHAKEPTRNRRAFAEAMNRVKEGMSEAEVLALLGKPDDVSTENHPFKFLRYGSSGHMKAATLGYVCIDQEHDRVQCVSGQGTPPPDGLFTEPELRRLLEALNDLPGLNAGHYNPRPVIRAVNLLQPLGKEKALAAIDEFLRVAKFEWTDHNAREGVFLVLRTLFDVPTGATVFPFNLEAKPGYMPPILVGAGTPGPSDEKLLPRFPIAIEGDIPFFLGEGYGDISGVPERPESHVAYFHQFGTLRAKPLSPTARPVEALEAFEKSPRWYFKSLNRDWWDCDHRERIYLGNQVMNLLDTVDRVEPDDSGKFISFGSDDRNKTILRHASQLAIRWDAKESKYVFLDGTSLQQLDPDRYHTQFWTPKIAGLKIEFSVKRQSRRYVALGLQETFESGRTGPRAIVRVINIKSPQKVLFDFKVGELPDLLLAGPSKLPAGTTGFSGAGTTVELAEGQEIRAVLIIGEKLFPSSVFKP
jgi:hypothetical protein